MVLLSLLQVPLHLPFESRSLREQKDLLGFEDVAESFITPQERKDAKRSDPGSGSDKNQRISSSGNGNQEIKSRRSNSTTSTATKSSNTPPQRKPEKKVAEVDEGYVDDEDVVLEEQENLDGLDEEEEGQEEVNQNKNKNQPQSKDNAASHNLKKYSTAYSELPQQQEQQQGQKDKNSNQQQQQQQQDKKASQSSDTSSSNNSNKGQKSKQSYDKTLLIQQERYKSTLPKIIITASASVSANGKKLNYSLGNVLGKGSELKIPPPTYDDYKEEDVVLDPFFQDVPKISKKH